MSELHIIFTAEVNQASANRFIQLLLTQREQGTERLVIAMNCPGGHVNSGVAIYHVMRSMPYEIVSHNISNVDSIANVIFLGADMRFAVPHATFMFHGVGLNAKEGMRLEEKNLKEYIDSIDADNNRLAKLIASRTNLNDDEGVTLFREQQTMGAEWAKTNALVSEIREYVAPADGPVQIFSE